MIIGLRHRRFNQLSLIVLLLAQFAVRAQERPHLGWINTFEMGYSQGFSICLDSDKSIISVGIVNEAFSGTIIYNTPTGIDSIVPTGFPCTIIQKTSSQGETLWIRELESVNNVVANDVAIDNNNNILVTGYFNDTTDFDPSLAHVLGTIPNLTAFVLKLDPVGNFIWVKLFVNSSGASKGIAIACDSDDDVIISGIFSGTADFDPNIGVSNLTSAGSGYNDVFVCKLNENGNLIWAKSNEGNYSDAVQSMTLDINQNILLTGNFFDTVDFDPGPAVYNLVADPFQSGGGIVFVQKLDNDGNFKWANSMGGNHLEYGEDITTDNEGNVYTLGRFNEDIDLDPESTNLLMTSAGSQDVFIQKVDSSGNLIWGKAFGGTAYDYGRGLAASNDGFLYVCGYFKLTTDLDPSSGTAFFSAEALYDAFLLKLDTAGNYIWGAAYNGNSVEHPARMVLDEQNNIYAAGYFEGSCDFDPSANSHVIATSGRSMYTVKFVEGFLSSSFEEMNQENLVVYPNPTGNFQTIRINVEEAQYLSIQLYSNLGQMIDLVYNDQINEGMNEIKVDFSNLSSGVYYYSFKFEEDGIREYKVVKD